MYNYKANRIVGRVWLYNNLLPLFCSARNLISGDSKRTARQVLLVPLAADDSLSGF